MHTLVWFIWAACLMSIALSTRNPLYLTVLLFITAVVKASLPQHTRRGGLSVIRFALFVVPFSAIFNALSVHAGDTVLFMIPGNIPVFSGPVTLEAMMYGAINGLMLTTVLSIFNTLNTAAAPHAWMRFAPRAYQSVGVAVSIALSFVPQVSQRIRDVRDAQAIRGHRVRGLRDWLPLWMPLLVGGLEQSMQLSEAMVARGFGATNSQASASRRQLIVVGGLALVLAGWLSRFFALPTDWLGLACIVAGALLLIVGLIRGGHSAPHTSYRQQSTSKMDIVCTVLCVAATAFILLPALFGTSSSLFYYPYPTLTLPAFDVWVGVALFVFLLPAIARRGNLCSRS